MAIIFGGITKGFSKNFITGISALKSDLQASTYEIHDIKWKSFKGGIQIHKNLPYLLTDLFTIDESDTKLVLISGAIYNQEELIENLNIKLKKITPAELILYLYQKFGEEFVSKLNGDFAIVIYDTAKNVLLFYRDHVGIKPLAYTTIDGDSFFYSDPIGLCKALYNQEGVDKNYLLKWLIGGNEMYHILPNNKVKKINPGHFIRISDKDITETKYWFPEKIKIDKSLTIDTVKSEISALLQKAVRTRADKRFFASAHLSGGLDSSIVASLAKKEYAQQKDFYGFSWSSAEMGTENISFDERQLVKDTCKLTGIKEVPFSISTDDYKEYENDWRIATYLYEEVKTRKDAQKLGVNLIFSGWGGDEFISINNRGIDADLFFNLQWAALLKKNQTYNPFRLAKKLLINLFIPAFYKEMYFGNTENFSIEKYFKLSRSEKKKFNDGSMTYKSRQEVHLKLLNENHLADRAEDWAVNGARKGIEYRYPLLDKDIIEFMLKVPSRLLYKDGYSRILLREISEGILPESVRCHRSKFDQVKFAGEKKLFDAYCKDVIRNSKMMEENQMLNFVDFKLLFKDTLEAIEESSENYASTHCRTVLYVKKMDSFIEGYNQKRN
ncbi:asparagine synthetase B family protein [Aequorivita sinensis]|uniref:asparagine synthetase B family protein n=1 Tax=Aequorivita sinensis TaxID=1382458 RepID=UPI002301A565|nr:asparagine synthase-related protein [Aequorivita sinensis]